MTWTNGTSGEFVNPDLSNGPGSQYRIGGVKFNVTCGPTEAIVTISVLNEQGIALGKSTLVDVWLAATPTGGDPYDPAMVETGISGAWDTFTAGALLEETVDGKRAQVITDDSGLVSFSLHHDSELAAIPWCSIGGFVYCCKDGSISFTGGA